MIASLPRILSDPVPTDTAERRLIATLMLLAIVTALASTVVTQQAPGRIDSRSYANLMLATAVFAVAMATSLNAAGTAA